VDKQGIREIIHALGKAVKLIWASSPRLVVVRALLNVVQGVLPLGSLYTIKLLVDLLSENKGLLHRPHRQASALHGSPLQQ